MQKTKNILCTILIFLLIVLAVFFSASIKLAMQNAVFVCLESIIPSLYFFMIISSMLMNSQFSNICAYALNRVSQRLFCFDGKILSIFILSHLGGYPIGIRLLSSLYAQGKISLKQAQIYSAFCFSSGPAFILGISANRQQFLAIMISCAVANLVVGSVLCRFSKVRNDCASHIIADKNNKICLVECVQGAAKSMLSICTMVIFVRALLSIPQQWGIIDMLSTAFDIENDVLLSVFEITHIFAVSSTPLSAALLSFGGICVFMQICALSEFKINTKLFITVRIFCGAIAFALCSLLYSAPNQSDIISAMAPVANPSARSDIIQSSMLIIMSCMLLLKNSRQIKNNVL